MSCTIYVALLQCSCKSAFVTLLFTYLHASSQHCVCLPWCHSPIVSLERSPFFDDIILSVGDWQFQIWAEGQQTPVFVSGYNTDYYTAGCWSPTRPGVIYLVDQSGQLEIWDLLDRSHEPSIKVTLTSTAIMSMSFNIPGGSTNHASTNYQFLALGDSAGVLHIMELPRNLRRPVVNERKLMRNLMNREMTRVTDAASRQPERLAVTKEAEERVRKAREAAEAAAKDTANKDQAPSPAAGGSSMAALGATGSGLGVGGSSSGLRGDPLDKAATSEEVRMEQEYAKIEHQFKIQLGLIQVEEKDDD